MSRELILVLTAVVALALLALALVAWRRRVRRDAQPLAPTGDLPDGAVASAAYDVLYVATTRHDDPLERIAAPGLAFRSRARLILTDRAVAFDLTGKPRIVLGPDRIVEVAQSTVAIDRVVESGGLTRIVWRTLADSLVDTYLRPQDISARGLADALQPLVSATGPSTPAPTGNDA